MMAWRSLASLAIGVVLAVGANAQTYPLQEKISVGSYLHIHLSMNLEGELHVQQEGKVRTLKQTATATHDFIERGLEAAEHGMAGRTARHYKDADVTITVENNKLQRILRPQRRLIIAQRNKDAVQVYSPAGKLTREELDLLQHFDTLAISGLLPNKAVAVGDSWKLHNAVAQALCYFDGLTAQSLTCTLVSVMGKKAKIAINGHATGIDDGASVNLKVDSTCQFDLDAGRIVSLEWTQQDERGQGPVSPAMKATVRIKMARTPIDAAPEVEDTALANVPNGPTPPATLTALEYTDPQGRYKLAPARDWITVAQTKQHLVVRLLDRGDFVAQATITSWPKAEAGKHTSVEDFQKAMTETPGWEQDAVQEAKEIKSDRPGYWIYRLAATGKLNGLDTLQYFYLVVGPAGNQLVIAFTMTPAQAARLGTRDSELVRSVAFPRNE